MPARSRLLLLLAPLLLLGIPSVAHAAPADSGPVLSPTAQTTTTTSSVTRTRHVLGIARTKIGDPYQYGAAGPNRFDCSGLVYFSTHRAGFTNVPRTSSEQARFMRRIPRSSMRAGDYVFFTGGSGVYHVGIFAGRKSGRAYIVHAPYSGAHVRRERVWTSHWFAGTLRR